MLRCTPEATDPQDMQQTIIPIQHTACAKSPTAPTATKHVSKHIVCEIELSGEMTHLRAGFFLESSLSDGANHALTCTPAQDRHQV